MDRFLIVTNDGKDADHIITRKVKELLETEGKKCVLCQKDEKKNIIKEAIPEDIECAIVIGGDGSLIEVARILWERDVPILGINMGTLGYLTEVEVGNIEEAIGQIVSNDYTFEDRMMLEAVLSALSDEERQIVTLHALTGLRHREIAALLGLPLPTVLSKYSRALKKLQLAWKEAD